MTTSFHKEQLMLEPLLAWLKQVGRINDETHVATELPWFGRRVDVATLTKTKRTAAYELKLSGLRRALEQASYNRVAFDRSYVVTGSLPRAENVRLAADHGIGIIVIRGETVKEVLFSPPRLAIPELRARLLSQLRVVNRSDSIV